MRALEQQFSMSYRYPVCFDRNVFSSGHPLFASLLARAGDKPHRVLCVVDDGVLKATPRLAEEIVAYAEANRKVFRLCRPIVTVSGGEVCKNTSATAETIMEAVRTHRICRQSFVLAIGGGAVLDAVGYGAAIAHRGVRLIRMPSTVLSQNDAGVGVKNGINAMGRKNFAGCFAPPFAVVNDGAFLETLPPRLRRAGIAEAVKMALIKDKDFFQQLYSRRRQLFRFERSAESDMVYRCAALHLDHIGSGGDPFETGSARPLDFGHWSAHKLEELTNTTLNHGEAVAVGITLDSLYSCRSGMIGEEELRRILVLIEDLGLPLYHPALADLDIELALDEFQEHLGGERAITLLTSIGSKTEVSRIDSTLMRRCINELRMRCEPSVRPPLSSRTRPVFEEHRP